MTYTAPATRVLTVVHLVDSDDCLTDCDPDCESGPRHCEWVHSPSHKPGWHAQADCPRQGHEATDGFTRCGLPMLVADLWLPVNPSEFADVICPACQGAGDEQETLL